jgi:pimeloyl-ACP methyl ester carboxylesterase
MSWILVAILTFLLALVVLSYIVEALRPAPKRPEILLWAPRIPIDYADLGGIRVRCIKAGVGPNLVLLHTLRTQLDMFEKIIPGLEKHFTVHAFDYPGHGWSDIPKAAYAPEDFYQWTVAYLDKLDIARAAVVGVSIGGTLSLMLAARQNPRVTRIIAVNPYDYWPAEAFARVLWPRGSSSRLRRCLCSARRSCDCAIDTSPIGSSKVAWRRPKRCPRSLRKSSIKSALDRVITGGFLSLLAHERLWPKARNEYASIKVPVLLVYGEHDWAPLVERERTRLLIPSVATEIVCNGSHFLSLDRPRELQNLIVGFARD